MQHLTHHPISKNSTQFLVMLSSQNPLSCKRGSMRWRRRKVHLHTLSMLSFQIMPMDTIRALLHLLLNLKLLQLRWCCQITLRVERWTSRGFAWYIIYPLPSRPIFMRVPSPEHMPSLKSTVPIWRRWVSSSVRSLTWNEQLAVGYHTWTKF